MIKTPSAKGRMETPKRTKAGEVSWTAAPGLSSPSSSGATSPSVGEDPLDFLHLMDATVGLSEAVEGGGWGGSPGGTAALHPPTVFSGTSGGEGTGTPTEELSSSRASERPTYTQPPCECLSVSSKSLRVDDKVLSSSKSFFSTTVIPRWPQLFTIQP